MTPDKSPTGARCVAERQGSTDRQGPRFLRRHRKGICSATLPIAAMSQGSATPPSDQGAARADRSRGSVRPRTRAPRLQGEGQAAEPAIKRVPAEQAPALRALRSTNARQSWMAAVRRYLCSGRRHGHGCEQPITKAEPLESQLADWLRAFQPDEHLRAIVLDTITRQANQEGTGPDRRAELAEQLRRLQDLFVLGDLTKAQYVMRRQAVQDELERLAPPADPQLLRSRAGTRRLLQLLGARARPRRAPPPGRHPHRGRAPPGKTTGALWRSNHNPPSPPTSKPTANTGNARWTPCRCQERERRGSNPRFVPRASRSRFGFSPPFPAYRSARRTISAAVP